MNNMATQMELFEPVKKGFDSGGLTTSTSGDQLLIDFNAVAADYNESRDITGTKRAITGQEMMSIFDALTKDKIKLTRAMQEGGLLDQGGTKDPVSGNDVPPGSTQEEVRDDIPAQLSEGEFVFPADVVRFIGLEKLMKIRQRAKAGLKMMEEMGQMGNSEEAIIPDDLPFSIDDLDMEDDGLEMNQGGLVNMSNGGLPTTGFPQVAGTMGMNPKVPTAPAPMQAASSLSLPQPTSGVDPNLGGTKFTGTAIQPITVPFQEAKGPGVVGVEQKNVVYVNEAGQERTFIVKSDGTIIDPTTQQVVDPTTLGFKVKTDETKKPETTTGVQTTRVTNDGNDGAGDEGVGTTTKDVTGIGYDRSKLDPKIQELVSAYGAGFGTLADTFFKGPRQALMDIPRDIATKFGAPDLIPEGFGQTALNNSLTSAAFGGVLDHFRGYTGQGDLFSKETVAGGIMNTSVYTNTKSLDQLSPAEVNRLDTVARAVVDDLKGIFETKDADGNITAKSLTEAIEDLKAEAGKYGIGTNLKGTNVIMRELAVAKSKELTEKKEAAAIQKAQQAIADFNVGARETEIEGLGTFDRSREATFEGGDDSGPGTPTEQAEAEAASADLGIFGP